MFKTRIFSLCVLPDDHQIQVFVSRRDTADIEAVHHVGKKIQLLSYGDVHGLRVSALGHGGEEGAFEANAVAPNALNDIIRDSFHSAG